MSAEEKVWRAGFAKIAAAPQQHQEKVREEVCRDLRELCPSTRPEMSEVAYAGLGLDLGSLRPANRQPANEQPASAADLRIDRARLEDELDWCRAVLLRHRVLGAELIGHAEYLATSDPQVAERLRKIANELQGR